MTDTAEPQPDARAPAAATKPAKRNILLRLFGIGPWSAFKLLVVCIFVGFIVLASQFDPASPTFNAAQATTNVAKQAWAALGWAARNFWKPALAGASVVLPVWVLWRLVSLPFRK